MPRKQFGTVWSRLTPFELDWIQVEVSARCDSRCIYCPVSQFRGKRVEGLMTWETFHRLESSFSSADMVFLQGWGEPLLHPQFWEMARRARNAGPKVGFTTNGTLLGEGNRQALLESGVEIMGVSLAGSTPQTHDRFREGNPLDVIDLNLRRLRREKEERGSDLPKIHLAYLLLSSNLAELQGVVDLAEEWGASQIVVSYLSIVLSSALEGEALPARSSNGPSVRSLIEEAKARAEEKGILLHVNRPSSQGAEPTCTENILKSCFVSAQGQVSPCVMSNLGLSERTGAVHLFRGTEYPVRTLTFGSLRDGSLEQIWKSRPARDFRRVFRERLWRGDKGTGGLPAPCSHCYKLFSGPFPIP